MAMDEIDISCSPAGEDCEQIGPDYDANKARFECQMLIHQLRRMFGEEPHGAHLYIKSCPHDFGTYHEVNCKYDDSSEEATEYAFRCQDELPEFWDMEAKAELEAYER